ncbi:DUF2142 domain-containing protein [uncultured Cellulomonas sp.]|uniref:DUF2142 domain-containing protein n=1 Tax=uncultured Cellulomonas sp. TaxID=189682 RepID=UPI00260F900D|nr:DUF2142 domain-containing protein [uncultured Cellulomonas sp.]
MSTAATLPGGDGTGLGSVAATPGRRRPWAPRTPRGVFWLSFVAMLLVTSGWVVGNPLIASVDEASHATKAAATVRGQWVPDTEGLPAGSGEAEVPELFEAAIELQYCIAFEPDQPASCQPELDGDLGEQTPVVTTAAAYNPLYYAVVGVPSLFPVGEHTLYLMRLVSAVLASAMFAAAVRTLAEVGRAHWLVYGLLAATTPMVIYLSSAVNPQTTEVMGAIALWVCLLTTLRYPRPDLLTRRLARIALIGVLFVNSRGMSPLFLVVLLVAVLVASPWSGVLAVLRDRRSWPWIALAAAGSVAAGLWILLADALPTVSRVINPELVGLPIVATTLGQTSYYLQSMIGIFGWLDTTLPGWLYYAFAGVVGLVVGLGVALARARVLVAMAGTALVVLGLPVAVQYFQARYLGVIWQGRYMLPLAVGLPVLAGLAVQARDRGLPAWLDRRVLRLAVLVVAAGHVVAYAVNMHRYVNGASGEWIGWSATSWLPPVNPWVLLAAYAAGWALVAVALLRAAEPGPSRTGDARAVDAPDADGAEADVADPGGATTVPDDAGTHVATGRGRPA